VADEMTAYCFDILFHINKSTVELPERSPTSTGYIIASVKLNLISYRAKSGRFKRGQLRVLNSSSFLLHDQSHTLMPRGFRPTRSRCG
jgi:hypothetical protein